MIRRYVELIGTPAVIIGGYLLFSSSTGFFSDAWDDFVGPLLITYWIGLGFTNTWDIVKQSMHGAPPLMLAFVGVAGSLILLGILGGPEVLVTDPWLFGVVIAPGLQLALPWWQHRMATAEPDQQTH